MIDQPAVTTFLFTDLEGSSRLWEEQPERMRPALARHDRILREAVERHRGVVVKMTGDGMHAAFPDPRDAVLATVEIQTALADPLATDGLPLHVRCGMHAGMIERRDGDYFGSAVNRAARIMNAAHGGQALVSQPVADLIRDRLPAGVTLRDLGNVRLRDLTSPERVYQVEHANLRRDFPALRSLEAVPNNLPQQLTTFVGREREQDEVKTALEKARLLTLSGIGGLGKTRLSLQVAAGVVGEYPDGVWFVEFAPITDPRLVPQAVASVLGVKEEAGRPVLEALVKHVRDRKLLLVLDNCEHLVQACAEVATTLLQASAQLRILASSREHFNIAGESIYTVPPLSVPEPDGGVCVDAIQHYAAVRLFVERAMAVQPAFRLTEKNVAAVVEICQRLDGIPLALELAAARVRALSVAQIAERVKDRFRLLTTGDRNALPRQQTLRALIDWSYDLLTQKEQILLCRLAVFAGGWTLEAAEVVCSGGAVSDADVLDLLTSLVDKSLVMIDPEGGRYGLLETVRQYADQRLQEAGEGDSERTNHLLQYVAFAERARPELGGPDQATWLARLDSERENLLNAHAWCDRAPGGAELGLRLANLVKHYWFSRGLLGLGYRVTVEALARVDGRERSDALCRGLFDAGQFCYFMGHYADAQRFLGQSLEIARVRDDGRRTAVALQPLGMASLALGDMQGARHYLEEAVALARSIGNKREIAAALNALAQLQRVDGQLEAADSLLVESVSLARDLHDREGLAIGLLNQAMVCISSGAGDRSQALVQEALCIATEIGSRLISQSVIEVSAAIQAWKHEWSAAARLFGAAAAHSKVTGLSQDPADQDFTKKVMLVVEAALGQSAFAEAKDAGKLLSQQQAMAEVSACLELTARPSAVQTPH